jgi:hypothetical protein
VVRGQIAAGGLALMMLAHSRSQEPDHGQCVGSRSVGMRCGRVSRAGTLTIFRRSVDPRAFAWCPSARIPVARSRLWATAAHRTHAEFAPNDPDGMCARGRPSIRSENTVSTTACARWVTSAVAVGSVVLVRNG